ncbi:MAG: amidohydrolase family protein [Marinovum sp.]|nr:amidohydrolase family protein [Marinovum sp.]
MTNRIDAHHHLWDLNAVHYPWLMAKGKPRFFGHPASIQRDYLLPELRRDAEAHGIAGSVHIQVGAESGWDEALWVDTVAQANPKWPMVQVAFCDLTAPDRSAQLDNLQSLNSVRGIRQIVGRAPGEDVQTGTNILLRDSKFLEGLHDLAERRLRFDLQLIPELIPAAAELFAKCPQLSVVLCHSGSPHDRSPDGLGYWASVLRDLSTQDQITCKLSGLGMFDHGWGPESFRPIVETVLEQFGATRVMWGSNFPVDSITSSYARLFNTIGTLVPEGMHDEVFHNTAARVYDLKV